MLRSVLSNFGLTPMLISVITIVLLGFIRFIGNQLSKTADTTKKELMSMNNKPKVLNKGLLSSIVETGWTFVTGLSVNWASA
jgi:hypothetical protein